VGPDVSDQESALGAPLFARVEGRRVVIEVESGDVVMWADLDAGDQLWLEFKGKRYLYRHVADQPTEIYPAENGSEGFSLGGDLSRGSVVGFPNYSAKGDVDPHALKVHDVRAAVNPAEVSYRFAHCASDPRKGDCQANEDPKMVAANNAPEKIDDIFEVRFEKLGGARLGTVGFIMQPALGSDEAVTAWAKSPVGQRLTGNQLSQESSDDSGNDDEGSQQQEGTTTNQESTDSGGQTAEEVQRDLEAKNAKLEAENAELEAAKQDEEDSKSNWKAFGMLTLGVVGGAVLVCAMSDKCFK